MARGWKSGDQGLGSVVDRQTEICLNVYRKDPSRVLQDANNELRISGGGYATRQLEELLQNAVDAAKRGGKRVEVVLTDDTLYVANDGEPFDEAGVLAVMASDISSKDDEKIGKFGIGFKSLLAVSRNPRVFSRTVSFGFDAGWAEKLLRENGHESPTYPAMRLARVLDPVADGSEVDPHLRELMAWASTVIVVPLSGDVRSLSRRLDDFPAEFVLFSPHVSRACLRNLTTAPDRKKKQRAERPIGQRVSADGSVVLTSGDVESHWVVTRTTHTPSAAARREGGHIAARDQVEIQYALGLPARGMGRFWAYFPTSFSTTLTGLINAPWKLSDDRTGLLDGAFNRELLDKLPRLVAQAFEHLGANGHAVSVIDAMPARGDESRNWVDDYINIPIINELRRSKSLPNGRGELCVPSELKWIGEVPAEWLQRWEASEHAPRGSWLHVDAYSSAERRKKVARLLQGDAADIESASGKVGLHVWLEALVAGGSVESSADAILLAAHLVNDSRNPGVVEREVQDQVRRAKIVRLESGDFRAPTRGKVFVRVEGQTADDVDFVDPVLTSIDGVPEALRQLGVVVMDRSGELRRLLARVGRERGASSAATTWAAIWEIARDLPREAVLRILAEDLAGPLEAVVHVRTAAGAWRPICQAFLAGRLIPADGSRDRDHLIDPRFHAADEELLKDIGAVDAPVWRHDSPPEPWMRVYDVSAREAFVARAKGGRTPDPAKIEVTPGKRGTAPPWPLEPVISLSPDGKVAATEHIMARPVPESWSVQHASNAALGKFDAQAPEVWFLRRHGLLRTAFGPRSPESTLMASDVLDPDTLPAVEVTGQWASALGVHESAAEFTAAEWEQLKSVADTWRGPEDDDRRSSFYAWLPGAIQCDSLVVRVGAQLQAVEIGNIGVVSDRHVYDSMIEAHVPALYVADIEDAERFIEAWEMPRGEDLLQEEIVVEPSGEAGFLTDAYPPLKLRLSPQSQELRLQPASRIVKMIATPKGQVARPIDARRDGDTVLVTASTPSGQLEQISRVLDLDLGQKDVADVLRSMERAATNKLRLAVKKAADDDARLVVAAGVEALRRSIPAQALQVLDGPDGVAPDEDVAALARAVHGVAILKQLRPALEERGLEPPREWAGRRTTRQWVASLGFPADWAGFPSSTRDAVEVIDGPVVLQPLHDYQETVTGNIKRLLNGEPPEGRGMVSLPTGAGKTRVTVQALVEAVRDGDVSQETPQVWIAQTDELCEQAAETWTYVWRAIGPHLPMRLGRLWATNEVPEEPGVFQLVIATIDKLKSVIDRQTAEYDWLREASVVVIDEAHTSIAPSYTQVLEWLGRSGRARKGEVPRPLIGLTATPFRGTSSDETARLVRRYGQNRLDHGAFTTDDPYEDLQRKGVLAKVKHRILDGGDVELTDSDIAEIEKMRHLPAAVTERLGSDLGRTMKVVDSIASLPADWTVLTFAPSVENARVLAALLSHHGVPAVSVSADTESAARRHYVEEFKAGRIRVITNFNVLTQGFDAPKVQAVYVARPTFSPNVYQQMVGRGLRGPKNGGSDEVLIVNVEDNFQKYGELLAFREFEYLWR